MKALNFQVLNLLGLPEIIKWSEKMRAFIYLYNYSLALLEWEFEYKAAEGKVLTDISKYFASFEYDEKQNLKYLISLNNKANSNPCEGWTIRVLKNNFTILSKERSLITDRDNAFISFEKKKYRKTLLTNIIWG